MKLFLNNQIPVLTEEAEPSRHCPTTCCFNALCNTPLSYYRSFRKRCNEGHSYTLQDSIDDIFKL